MKRASSSELNSGSKRFEGYPSPSQYQPQPHQLNIHQQQQQMRAQHQLQAHQQHQFHAQQQQQQQQQFQHQLQAAQQQQMQAAQQQQQFATNQQFYNQPQAYFPPVNFPPFPQAPAPLLFNNSPQWNFMSTPPPFYNTPPPASASNTHQPPLPPPDMKPDKPPLPSDPEPGSDRLSTVEANSPRQPYNGMPALGNSPVPGGMPGIRMRPMNPMNPGMFNGFNGGMRGLVGGRPLAPNGAHGMNVNSPSARGRRRNTHFFPQMTQFPPPTAPMLGQPAELQDFARLIDDDQPAGPEKVTIFMDGHETGRVQVNKKAKRKPMSTRYTRTKLWNREEAEAAIALETEFNRMQKRPMLILKFPDPDLNKYIVKKYSPLIDSVHFQQPSTPRYCFVQLKEDADVEKVISTIRQIPFGTGTINAELKNHHLDDQPVTPEEIDPYTLYIGNLPTHISVKVVKQYFPNAQRIDIGYAQRMRYTRYAFIRYNTVAEAMASYKRTVNALLDSRSLIVRFRRQKGNIGLPGEAKINAPRREGREILPRQEPVPLDQSDGDRYLEDISECEAVEDEADDDDEVESLPRKKTTTTGAVEVAALSLASKELEKAPGKEESAPKSVTPSERADAAKSSKAAPSTPETLEDEADKEDTKENVLEEARELMSKKNDIPVPTYRPRAISPGVIGIYPEPAAHSGHVEGDIKLEESDDGESSDDGGINLLGSRVKDEPYEEPNRVPSPSLDDIYRDDYEYDDLDCEPEEEDDEWTTGSEFGGPNWDAARRTELNAREDKPDLEQLDSVQHVPPAAPAMPIPVDIEPKPEKEDLFVLPAKNKRRTEFTEKDDLHDMFAQLNSDGECDDDDAFFG